MPGGDGDGPDGAVVVPVRLADGGGEAADADAVAAHDGVLEAAVLIHVGHAHGLGVPGAQLEDVAHLDAAGDVDVGLAALGADAALEGLGHVHVADLADVAGDVEADVVPVVLAGPGGEPLDALEAVVVHHGHALGQADGAGEAGVDAAVPGDDGGVHLGLEEVAQLGLIDVQVAADEHDHEGIVGVALIHDRLAGLLRLDLEEFAQLLDGLAVGGVHLLEGRDLAGRVGQQAGRRLHVGAVVAVAAQHDGVLADVGQQHVLVGDLAAHHAAVGGHRHHLGHAAAGVDAVVGVVAAHVVLLQILLGGVEGVGVLHGELAHADQAAAAAGLVAELGLDLVDHEGILGVGVGHVGHELHGRLLVGHAQHHVRAGAVLEAQKLRADGVEAARLAPDVRGHRHREQHLLAVDAVHLLADDRLDLRGDALGDGEQREYAVAHGLDVAAAHHQRLGRDDAVRRSLLEPLGNEISDLHDDPPRRKKSFDPRGAKPCMLIAIIGGLC